MKYRIIYILFLPIIYFFLKWTYNSIIMLSSNLNYTKEQLEGSRICVAFWTIILFGYIVFLNDKYKLIDKTMNFLTKKRTFKL